MPLKMQYNPKELSFKEITHLPLKHLVISDHPNYRERCMRGEAHPIGIEKLSYTLINIGTYPFDLWPSKHAGGLEECYNDIMDQISSRPEIEWAVDNSFDGLYIERYDDPSAFKTSFKFAVYMKEEHITFWKLKYSGI